MREKRYSKDMKGTQEQKKGIKTMSNQIKLNDGETLIGAVCENCFRCPPSCGRV